MMDEAHVYMCLRIASIKSTVGNRTRLCPHPLFISTSWFLSLTEAFRKDHVAACSTALRSATENEMDGYVTIPGLSKMTQRIGLNSSYVTRRLITTERIRNKYSVLKSRSLIIAVIDIANLLTLSILVYLSAQVNLKSWIYIIIN